MRNFPALFRTLLWGRWSDLFEHDSRGACACVGGEMQTADARPSDPRQDVDAHQQETLPLYAERLCNSQESGTVRSKLWAERLAREALALQMGIAETARMTLIAWTKGSDASPRSSETGAQHPPAAILPF